jgi:hypothetical protein
MVTGVEIMKNIKLVGICALMLIVPLTATAKIITINNQVDGEGIDGNKVSIPLKVIDWAADQKIFDEISFGQLTNAVGTFTTRSRLTYDLGVLTPPIDCPAEGAYAVQATITLVAVWQNAGDAIVWVPDETLPNVLCLGGGSPLVIEAHLVVQGGSGKYSCVTGELNYFFDASLINPPEFDALGVPGVLQFNPSSVGKGVLPRVKVDGFVDFPNKC